jgi:hypothetical protein
MTGIRPRPGRRSGRRRPYDLFLMTSASPFG